VVLVGPGEDVAATPAAAAVAVRYSTCSSSVLPIVALQKVLFIGTYHALRPWIVLDVLRMLATLILIKQEASLLHSARGLDQDLCSMPDPQHCGGAGSGYAGGCTGANSGAAPACQCCSGCCAWPARQRRACRCACTNPVRHFLSLLSRTSGPLT